jgi:hypothetical protein
MPLQQSWLIPDQTGSAPVDRWLGTLKALHTEATQVVNRLRAGALEGGIALTAAQKTALLNWYDSWQTRLNDHVRTVPS